MSSIAKNMLWLLLSQVATWAVAIVSLIVVPRLITDDAFGRASFAFTFVSFFTLVALMGSGSFIIKSTARDELNRPGSRDCFDVPRVWLRRVAGIRHATGCCW